MIEYLNQLERKINHITGTYSLVCKENTELKNKLKELEKENIGLKEIHGQVRERVEILIKKIGETEDK